MLKALPTFFLIVQVLAAQRTSTIKTPQGDLEFTLLGARLNQVAGVIHGSIVDGSVRNPTRVDINYLRFEFVYLDQDGNPLDVCNVPGNPERICVLTIFETIRAGASAALTNPGNRFNPGKVVPKNRVISGFATRLLEARYSPQYSFGYKVKEMPQFEATFTIGVEDGVAFVLRNKLESPIEILWDQSSFIGVSDDSSRLIRTGVKYIDKDRPQPNTIIPPLARVSDTIYPSNHIVFSEDRWLKTSLLPTNLEINQDPAALDGLLGKSIRLYLRFMIDEKKVDYLVSFPITSVSH